MYMSAVTMSRFAVTRLTLTDFRNYAAARIETDASLIALTGANGAGKTNLLEAISLLAPGRGLRGASFDELARVNGRGGWAVAANIASPAGSTALGTGWTRPAGESDSLAREVV